MSSPHLALYTALLPAKKSRQRIPRSWGHRSEPLFSSMEFPGRGQSLPLCIIGGDCFKSCEVIRKKARAECQNTEKRFSSLRPLPLLRPYAMHQLRYRFKLGEVRRRAYGVVDSQCELTFKCGSTLLTHSLDPSPPETSTRY